MRHPLRRMAKQGAWYALSSALTKVSGFLLLPVLTNTRYLSVGDYGRWGILEITSQIAVAIVGLALPLGMVRYYAQEVDSSGRQGSKTVSSTWWLTVVLAVGAALLSGAVITLFTATEMRTVFGIFVVFAFFELLLTVPLALLRAQERAALYTGLFGLKLLLLVALALYLLTSAGQGLLGLTAASAGASGITLALALLAGRRREYLLPKIDPETARRLLRFSVPLVIGGLGSLALNAGDRYVLATFRTNEELAVYTLAGRFGGVVNMFVVQPFNLAWLPLLFRLDEGQRPEVLRLLMPYLTMALCLVVVGMCLFAGPLLGLMGSAAPYHGAIRLLPWIGFGFVAFGLSMVFAGVLALFQRTRFLSVWLAVAAMLNLVLNLLLVPRFGAMAAALNTLIGYLFLLIGEYRASRGYIAVAFPWGRLAGMLAFSLAVSLVGSNLPAKGPAIDLAVRCGLLAGWALVLLATRWVTVGQLREAWTVLRGGRVQDRG